MKKKVEEQLEHPGAEPQATVGERLAAACRREGNDSRNEVECEKPGSDGKKV